MNGPNPNTTFPLANVERLCFLKNIIKNPNINVGDYTYYDDFENVLNFEKNVKYHFDFIGDKLVIGKYCMIASDVQFIMNGGNHMTDCISAFPFAVFGNGWEGAMKGKKYPTKGDTIIGNDVWIGHHAVIMPGTQIGDGAMIGSYSIVTKNVEPYAVVAGNPAKLIRKRYSDEVIEKLLNIRWWDWSADKISRNLEFLTGNDIAFLEKCR
jgi:virginiamycin A acetyltransferase